MQLCWLSKTEGHDASLLPVFTSLKTSSVHILAGSLFWFFFFQHINAVKKHISGVSVWVWCLCYLRTARCVCTAPCNAMQQLRSQGSLVALHLGWTWQLISRAALFLEKSSCCWLLLMPPAPLHSAEWPSDILEVFQGFWNPERNRITVFWKKKKINWAIAFENSMLGSWFMHQKKIKENKNEKPIRLILPFLFRSLYFSYVKIPILIFII